MGKRYSNAPIIEAVCEFRFPPSTGWDLTIPGLLYEKMSSEFRNKEQRLIHEVEITKGPEGLQQQIRTNERILFLTDDRKAFVQIGPHLLAINCLKPYPTWSGFKPKIAMAFQALTDVVNVTGIQRIGLRYINRIEIPGHNVDLGEYFEFRPLLGRTLPQDVTSLIVGCVLPFVEGRDSCKVQLTTAVPEKPNESAFILDLDYFLTRDGSIKVNRALEWIEEAHQEVEKIFEGCLSENLKGTFGRQSE